MIRRLVLFVLLPLATSFTACSSTSTAGRVTVTPEVMAGVSEIPSEPVDPVLFLIAESDASFRAGQQALELGHVETARQHFDRAIQILIESPHGGRTEPRIREHFDRLVDRISAYEVRALAEGDGFTEKRYEEASIDQLLAMSATLTPSATPAVTEAAQSDPAVHDVPIPLNARVLAFIELFQGRLHDFIQEGLQRGSRYLPMIQNVLRAEGLPLDLAYIPLVESAFKPNALSRARAKGVWQFMRGTGLENGLRQDWFIDERSDPEKATAAAARYLATLSKMFNGDWHLALASYNGGPGRVQRAMRRSKLNDFWKLAARPNLLPRETRDYVPMILAAIVIARNPAQYGFDFTPEPSQPYEVVVLDRPVDLRRIAEWTDSTIDEIQALNPELRRWTTPVGDTKYELKVPMGDRDLITVRLQESAASELASLKWHTVKRGETLTSIARSLRVSRTDLAEANDLRSNARAVPGQQLIVPQEPTVLMAARTDRPAPPAESRQLTADAVLPAAQGSEGTDLVKVIYRVKRGDTLAAIARSFQTTVASLRTWNGIQGSRILAGDRLTIYTARAN
jgi:membrane-bound lytic murein transglycosylase D